MFLEDRAGIALTDDVRAALAGLGFNGPFVSVVAGDASGRRYYRAAEGGRSVLIMISPDHALPICTPEMSVEERTANGYDASVRRNLHRVDAFACIGAFLAQNAILTPKVLHVAEDVSFALVEDFGALDLRLAFDHGYSEAAAYDAALGILQRLNRIAVPDEALAFGDLRWRLQSYDEHALLTESSQFLEHYSVAVAGFTPSEAMWQEWKALCLETFRKVAGGGVVLRDFHSPNIIIRHTEASHDYGVIDFQDALIGPKVYDVVSLLEDARRDVDVGIKRQALAAAERIYAGQVGDFLTDYAIVSLQRSLKIIGGFSRHAAMGDRRYVQNLPRVKASIDRALLHPALTDFRNWLIGARLYTPVGL